MTITTSMMKRPWRPARPIPLEGLGANASGASHIAEVARLKGAVA